MEIKIVLTEGEILSLIEIISRKNELSKPKLMYENYLPLICYKINYELEKQVEELNE